MDISASTGRTPRSGARASFAATTRRRSGPCSSIACASSRQTRPRVRKSERAAPELDWPVPAQARALVEDDSSAGISASLCQRMRLVLGDAERIESRLATRFRCSIVPYALPVLPRLDQQLPRPALSPAARDDRQALLVAAELRATSHEWVRRLVTWATSGACTSTPFARKRAAR